MLELVSERRVVRQAGGEDHGVGFRLESVIAIPITNAALFNLFDLHGFEEFDAFVSDVLQEPPAAGVGEGLPQNFSFVQDCDLAAALRKELRQFQADQIASDDHDFAPDGHVAFG